MLKRIALSSFVFGAMVLAVLAAERSASQEKQKLPEMKFEDVAEVAPGVFFRYSSISATDPKIPFGGCNNIWIVCKDHVVVVDANFPKEAADVIAAIKKTTNKPIKYVLDTHHHGDHAYGNCVWAKEGAQIIAHKNAARLLQTNGPKQWAEAANGRKDIKDNELKQADITFEDRHVMDDGTQRIEFMHMGHSHTAGDAVAYLPKYKILCTGDACVNGAFNFMGHSNSASWIHCLEKMAQLDIDLICPGHGPLAHKELLDKQKRYFVEMRQEIKKGIDKGQSLKDIRSNLDMAWYKDWTGKAAKDIPDNVKHVYDELTGKIAHERIGMRSSPMNYYSREALTHAPTANSSTRLAGNE